MENTRLIKEYWSKLPNSIVWSYKKGEECLSKDNDKLIPILVYLDTHYNNVLDATYFTLEDMITSCGFIVKTGKGKSIEQFKTTLIYLQSMGWLDKDLDIKNIKTKEFIQCKFNITYVQKKDKDNEWFKLPLDTYNKIMECDTKMDKYKMLKVYCHIASRIKHNKDGEVVSKTEYMCLDGVNVEYMYDTLENMGDNIGINKDTFNLCVKELNKLKLVFSGCIGQVVKKGSTTMASTVYTVIESELERALRCSKKYYQDEGYTINEKINKEVKQVNGLKGKIISEKNKGKDTTKLEDKLKEMQDNINKKTSKVSIADIRKEYLELQGDKDIGRDDINEIDSIEEMKEELRNLKEELQMEGKSNKRGFKKRDSEITPPSNPLYDNDIPNMIKNSGNSNPFKDNYDLMEDLFA